MPCPTCSATLQRANASNNPAAFHCPRCGTLVCQSGDRQDIETPKLVEYAKALVAAADDCLRMTGMTDWLANRLRPAIVAVREASMLPEER